MSLASLLDTDRRWMRQALAEAERAYEAGEVPVGAVVVQGHRVVGRGHNQVERLADPTAHAEMLAVSAACQTLGTKFLTGCTLYVTLEPCPMCAGALVWARLDRLVFGALDEKAGAASTLYDIPGDRRLNHQIPTVSGVEADRAADLLRDFFRQRRTATPPPPGAVAGDGADGEPPPHRPAGP
ncbi:tRNA adenosine(34) deaminase TadA [Rubrivirga sp. IMCC43871]|uniref:tRNA adenosine(34) deaminase TadA n=1 Tax=Rubrivirga sp. IMCC43871 TaxID=3391575 RepID=UPI00398FC5F1